VLVRKLIEQGEKVRALIWRGEDTTPLKDLDVETVEGDVLDSESLKPAFKGVEKVFHLNERVLTLVIVMVILGT
jgi:uncharacterized protein YbjT (DUF2867 family)